MKRSVAVVIDRKKFFDPPEQGLTDLNRVIVVHDEHMAFGMLADALLGLRFIVVE